MKNLRKSGVFIFVLFFSFMFFACKSVDTSSETFVKSSLDVIKDASIESFTSTLNGWQDTEVRAINSKYIEVLIPKIQEFKYKIISSEKNGDNFIVKTEIESAEIGNAFVNAIQKYFNEVTSSEVTSNEDSMTAEDMDSKLIELLKEELNSSDIKSDKNTVDIVVSKDSTGNFIIDNMDEVRNAVSGDLPEALKKLSESSGQ